MQFSVAQQPPGAAPRAHAPTWQTCLRQISFLAGRDEAPADALVWHDEAAYAHLLEVICGLHSPMVGETEVLHQFKVFAGSLPPEHAMWREICERLLADARAVRARHLIGLGSRSYGSAVRRYLGDCPRVALFGTGVLAREVLPYLSAPGRVVDVWGRREACPLDAPDAHYRRLNSVPAHSLIEPSALVIAAPMRSSDIARAAACYAHPLVLIDLRAEGAADPPPPVAPHISLADVFAEFLRSARATDASVAAAREEIRRRASGFGARTRLNPSGWHDLCA